MRKTFALVFLSAAFLIPEVTYSQSFYTIRSQRSVILSGGTGSSTYYGDLVNPGVTLKYQPNVNVGLQYFLHPRISVRGELNWFRLEGSDANASDEGRRRRNLSFYSSCFELSATGIVNLYSNGPRFYRRPKINFYGFAGVGLLYFNPMADYKGQSYSLQPLRTEGVAYSRLTPVIPYGLGVRLRIGPYTNIVVEGGWRKTFTDYLDDVSGRYVNNASFTDPIAAALADRTPEYDANQPIHKAGQIRGNPDAYDSYFLLNAKVEYYLKWDVHKRKGHGLIANKKNRSTFKSRRTTGPRKKLFGIF
jgi:hypothetical protein